VEILVNTGMKKQYKKEEMNKEPDDNPFAIIVICVLLFFLFLGMMIMIATPSN
jgi:hypothetical protein